MVFFFGAETFTTIVIGLSVLLFAVAIRRLFFHPLSHIPGPRLAALTWWYEFYYDGIKNGRYVFKIQELHKQYGPIIRITPDELHINDVGFIDTVYAPSSSRRDKYEYQLRTLRIPGGVGTSASHDLHKKRRESLTPFFSKRNVQHLEPLIQRKVKQLQEVLTKHAELQTSVNLSDVFFAFANDIAFDFLFARKANLLGDEAEASRVRINSYSLLQGINVNKHFPWFPDLLEALPLSISKPLMPPELVDLFDLFAKVRAELVTIKEAKEGDKFNQDKGLLQKQSVYESLVDDPDLPPQEKTLLRLEQEGSLLVLAGSESPAASLKILFFHLIKNPDVLNKLRTELATVSVNASWIELEKLPYLSAVIQEAHRLSWGVTARLARIAHELLTYTPSMHVADSVYRGKTYVIPSGTPISITTLSAHTAESVFPDPYRFDPDRWLGDEGRERRKYQMAFSRGSRKCIGIELADAEMRLVTAAVARSFDMTLFETDESDVSFQHDYQVAMPRLDSKGLRVKVSAA